MTPEDKEFAKWFLSDAEKRMIGRIASPCPEEDVAVLRHYLKGRQPPYFEVGVLWGGSIILAGLSMDGHLYGIDPFFGYMKPGRPDPHAKNTKLVPTREIVEKNIAAYDLTDRVTLYTGTHPPLPEELRNTDSYFGAIFIDGDHQTQSVLNDWNELKYHASDIVIFHDLHHSTIKPAWEAIKKDPFVEEVLYEGGAGKYSRMGVVKVK
jgi:predicted O-methyltransferase YrrM